MNQNTSSRLVDYATRLGVDPRLLHVLIATAKQSDSPVIRYGAVAVDEQNNIVGTGYSKLAQTDAELGYSNIVEGFRWSDTNTPPRLHAEMGALRDAESKGYDIRKLRLFILPLSPAENPAKPAGYIMLREMKDTPRFSCTDCAPKLQTLGIQMNVLNGTRGWDPISPEQAKLDGEALEILQTELRKETNDPEARICRAGEVPGSVIKKMPHPAPGYHYISALLSDMQDINWPITAEQETAHQRFTAEHSKPNTNVSTVQLASHVTIGPEGKRL